MLSWTLPPTLFFSHPQPVMSCAVGLSSYFLWTQKGLTVLPLVRGSAFLLAFKQQHAFYRYHVVTASHVANPVRHRSLYGDSIGLNAIGERHVSTRLLAPQKPDGPTGGGDRGVGYTIALEFTQHFMPNTDIAVLRCKNEQQVVEAGLAPLEVDPDPIEEGTTVMFCGVRSEEERANPNDDGLRMHPCTLSGTCKAALVSHEYGTVLLASMEGAANAKDGEGTSLANHPLPLSMCGGPVLRRSTGKCVGVTVARACKNAPPRDPHSQTLFQDPYLDISETTTLHHLAPLEVAFVPIGEFYQALKRTEI